MNDLVFILSANALNLLMRVRFEDTILVRRLFLQSLIMYLYVNLCNMNILSNTSIIFQAI
jgi:hypothetical protein